MGNDSSHKEQSKSLESQLTLKRAVTIRIGRWSYTLNLITLIYTMGNETVSAAHSAKTHSWNGVEILIRTASREQSHWLQKKVLWWPILVGMNTCDSGPTIYGDVAPTKWFTYQHLIMTLLDLSFHEQVYSTFSYIQRDCPKWIISGRPFRCPSSILKHSLHLSEILLSLSRRRNVPFLTFVPSDYPSTTNLSASNI
jgi:hypothetical protein